MQENTGHARIHRHGNDRTATIEKTSVCGTGLTQEMSKGQAPFAQDPALELDAVRAVRRQTVMPPSTDSVVPVT
jgi:hypothetical protein